MTDVPCLSLAIDQLSAGETRRYVAWVLKAPYASGYVLHERPWQAELSQAWSIWQTMFSRASAPQNAISGTAPLPLDLSDPNPGQPVSYSTRLMQYLGIQLWQWLFTSTIRGSLDKSQGIALGQQQSLRLRLEIRDADLLQLPWEIMQADAGQRAVSLGTPVLFSRTISEVEPLAPQQQDTDLRILLVVGQPYLNTGDGDPSYSLDLSQDVEVLTQALQNVGEAGSSPLRSPQTSQVTCLMQPTPADLIAQLDASPYNVFVYAGHGAPGPDGGRLFLSPNAELNGMELAQVLTRHHVKLAVFNACWGAQADRDTENRPIPRSSLAEVLICQGVPSVLGMRDMIADSEALSFVQAFMQTLAQQGSVDRAVAAARQQLLTLYKFNQPAWTLPVLYMHPEFDGQIRYSQDEALNEATEIPDAPATWIDQTTPTAALRTVKVPPEYWPVQGGLLRVGKEKGNDLVIQAPGVSRKHAEIFYRGSLGGTVQTSAYYLKDFSRFGTFIRQSNGWRCVHNEEVPLVPYMQVKFGSHQNQSLEFVVVGEAGGS
ncbi:MAG: CHAT domain-containing protein [Elainellaceae cyanobacterium]